MATHSGVLAWRIPGTGEPGGLLSMGSHRVGHDWSNLAAAAAATRCVLSWWLSGKESACSADVDSIPRSGRSSWRRKWQLIPVFLPGEFHGQRSLVGYRPWGHKESGMRLNHHHQLCVYVHVSVCASVYTHVYTYFTWSLHNKNMCW